MVAFWCCCRRCCVVGSVDDSVGVKEQKVKKPITKEIELDDLPFFADVMPVWNNSRYNSFSSYITMNLEFQNTNWDTLSFISSVVYVQFGIDIMGKVFNAKIIKPSGNKDFDQEALKVVKFSPLWIPAKDKNKPIPIKMTIPIRICFW